MQAPSHPDLVVALHAVGPHDRPRVGAKAATLGLLVQAGLAVPEGLVLTTGAMATLAAATPPTPTSAAAGGQLTGTLPPDLEAALASVSAYFGESTLAVRSCAVDEDQPDASFAGQYETVLHVRGSDALKAAVLRCHACAGSDRVRTYRRTHGRSAPAPIAVLVQRQVAADVAGVAFTADPVSGSCAHVLVSAVPGLGDTLVSGQQEPDEWVVSGDTATAVRVRHQALAEAQAHAVAVLARRVEAVLGGAPQDVEWAMAGGQLVVLQARPITALPQPPMIDLPPGTWVKETERHPEPLSALGASVAAPLIAAGLTDMCTTYGGLIERFETHPIGGEPYSRIVPVGGHTGPPPPWWALAIASRLAPPLRARMRTARRMLRPEVLDGLTQRWWTQWRPSYQRTARALREVRLGALSDDQLHEHIGHVHRVASEAMHVHFQLIPPYLVPIRDLMRTCERVLGWSELEALSLLAGTSEMTSEPTRALAQVAERIRQNPHALAALDRDAGDPGARLAELDPELATALADWSTAYACRNINDDPASPTLDERPELVIELLRSTLRSAGDGDATAQVAAREAARQHAREQLPGHPRRVRERFERELSAALRAYPLREDVAFWTGSMFGGLLRTAALEAGRRLVARGLLERPGDVVHLDIDTLHATLAGPVPGDLRARIGRARAERAWVSQHPGPAFHGPAPAALPDVRGLPRDGRRLNEALLWMQERAAPAGAAAGDVLLTGVPGSPGRHTGTVRIVLGEADFARLRPGEVLVCPTTDPAWSVLFGIAGALVTDGGAVLSHAAIVAREHAIPAVVGTGNATTELHDGQLVTVEGSTGRVHAVHTPVEPGGNA